MHDIGGGSWRSTNALASIDAEVELLSGSYREVRRIKAVSYLPVIYGAERNDPEPRTRPVFWVERTSSVHQQKTGNNPHQTLRKKPGLEPGFSFIGVCPDRGLHHRPVR